MSTDQNPEPCGQSLCSACRRGSTPLTGAEREIAIQAISALASGTPVEAAYQILAGIEALDCGPEGPLVVLWPRKDFLTGEDERAEWHRAESERLLAGFAEFQRRRAMATKQGAPAQIESESAAPKAEDPPPNDADPSGEDAFLPKDRTTVWNHMEILAGARASTEDLEPLSESERIRREIDETVQALLAEGPADECP